VTENKKQFRLNYLSLDGT